MSNQNLKWQMSITPNHFQLVTLSELELHAIEFKNITTIITFVDCN